MGFQTHSIPAKAFKKAWTYPAFTDESLEFTDESLEFIDESLEFTDSIFDPKK